MTVPEPTPDEALQRRRFAQLRELREPAEPATALRWIRSRWACRRTSKRRSPKARLWYGWVRRFLEKGKTESVMKITFIGGGNMAEALIGGLLRKDFPLQDIRVVEISAEARRKLADKYGVTSFDKPKDAMRRTTSWCSR